MNDIVKETHFQMRDGIWKNLPMPTSWRNLLRRCERQAERGEHALRAAEWALEKDARREISSAFLRGLKKLAGDSDSMLTGSVAFVNVRGAREIGGSGSSLEEATLNCARQFEQAGLRGVVLVKRALEQAFAFRGESRGREIEAHALLKAGSQARPMIQAMRRAQGAVDCRAMASRILSGEGPASSSRRPPVDADEDLTRPR